MKLLKEFFRLFPEGISLHLEVKDNEIKKLLVGLPKGGFAKGWYELIP
jgi:hypothetical protein